MFITSRKTIFVMLGALGAPIFSAAAATEHNGMTKPSCETKALPAKAPLLEGMGSWSRAISTRHSLAQRYFDQGLTLAYGFNHAEAERSFLEAAKLDPSCAICFWGAALVLGPNINAPMSTKLVPRAFAHLKRARDLAHAASPSERALIEALSARYSARVVADRTPLDRAYASAMREVARRFPDDPDILALAAEAQMDLSPWNYWADDGSPREGTQEIIATLSRAMELAPKHPGANHYYIHIVEGSPNPERGLDAADRLANLVPGAGHLVHMPAHIYLRTGRYHAAAEANERAILADHAYLAFADPANPYLGMYRLHNPHFLWAAATLEGRSEVALRAARLVAEMAHHVMHGEHAMGMETMFEHFAASPLFALVRFGKWQEILQESAPPEGQLYSRGVWHYARALAYSGLDKRGAALVELAALESIAREPSLVTASVSGVNSASAVLAIATEVTRGVLAANRGDVDTAITHLKGAILLEDKLRYMEPADWHYPVRQILGKVLVRHGRFVEAERVSREDLVKLPENGYSLFGLAEALRGQGKLVEAREVQRRFEVAFSRADLQLELMRD